MPSYHITCKTIIFWKNLCIRYAQKNIWKDTHQNEGNLWGIEIEGFYFHLLDTEVLLYLYSLKTLLIKTNHASSNVVQNAMKSLTFKRQK